MGNASFESRPLRAAHLVPLIAATMTWLACGGDPSDQHHTTMDSGVTPGNKDVGSACTAASDCASPGTPACFETLAPLQGIPESQILDHTAYDSLSGLGLTFANGYCSSAPNCASQSDCGPKGDCYRPFSAVTAATLRDLEVPLGVAPNALDFLPSYGVCLRSCTASSDCERGQFCELPLDDLVSLVPGSSNPKPYCVPCSVDSTDPNCTAAGAATVSIGGACTEDSQCNVVGTPQCLAEVHPLMDLVAPNQPLAAIGLDFPRGYCSNEPNCIADVQCGPHGKCLAPFRDVEAAELRSKEAAIPVPSGSLDFLPPLGICLRSCADNYECFSDQACQIVMDDFIPLIVGSVNTKHFCVPVPECRFCNTHASCVTPEGGTPHCVCDPGYDDVGNSGGLSCAPTGAGACADSPCENGGSCTDNADGSYTCLCTTGYSGTNCQLSQACNPNPCKNGGTCTPNGAAPMCTCAAGYSGTDCGTAAVCPTLVGPANGTMSLSGSVYNSDIALRGTATYGCISGYTLSVNDPPPASATVYTRTCQANGSWSGVNPVCNANGPCSTSPCGSATCTPGVGSDFTCSCPSGYTYDGVSKSCKLPCDSNPTPCGSATCVAGSGTAYSCTCPVGQTFNSNTKACDPVNCGVLGNPTNGMVATSNGTDYNDVATYTCNATFTMSGSPTRTCQANGQWSGTAPSCNAAAGPCTTMPCAHGTCTQTGPTTRTCDCTASGYTGTDCQTPINCGAPPVVANSTSTPGTITTADTEFNDVVMYSCNANHTLVSGSASRTCQADTTWSGTTPVCQVNSACSTAPCQNGGTCADTTPGNYTCDCSSAPGYTGMNCQTPITCDAPAAPTNGTVTPSTGTVAYNASATYACNGGYQLTGTAARVCNGVNTWATAAPTCAATTCGSFYDVVYRLTGTFAITQTPGGAGNQTFTGLTNNLKTPPFVSATNTTPFVGSQSGGTFTGGFARLRFSNNGTQTGAPVAGSVQLIEWLFPLEFTQTAGATVYANTDHSVGILNNPGALSNCGGGDSACTGHAPTVNRTCTSHATGTLSNTTLTWGACSPATTAATGWNYVMARTATGAGCASPYVQYGNTASSSIFVPASGKGDAYQVYNQQLSNVTFSSTNYASATWSMGQIQIPNGTGQSVTWLTITNATPIGTDCGTTPGTDLICNVQ